MTPPQTRHLLRRGDGISPPQEEPASNSGNVTSSFEPDTTGVSSPPETGAEESQGTRSGPAEGVTAEMAEGGTSKSTPRGGGETTSGSKKKKYIPDIDASRKSKLWKYETVKAYLKGVSFTKSLMDLGIKSTYQLPVDKDRPRHSDAHLPPRTRIVFHGHSEPRDQWQKQ